MCPFDHGLHLKSTLQLRNLTTSMPRKIEHPASTWTPARPPPATARCFASIRGVGQDDFAFNLHPAVRRQPGRGLPRAHHRRKPEPAGRGPRRNPQSAPRALCRRQHRGWRDQHHHPHPGNEQNSTAQATERQLQSARFRLHAPTCPSSTTLCCPRSPYPRRIRDGYVNVIPYPQHFAQGQTPSSWIRRTRYPKSAYETGNATAATTCRLSAGKLVWNASDKHTVTSSADWTLQDQDRAALYRPRHVQRQSQRYPRSRPSTTCISNNAAIQIAAAIR